MIKALAIKELRESLGLTVLGLIGVIGVVHGCGGGARRWNRPALVSVCERDASGRTRSAVRWLGIAASRKCEFCGL